MNKTKINRGAVQILVKTNAKKTRILCYDEKKQAFIVEVSAEPENNKANEAIIKLFEKETGYNVKIIKGKTSKKKTLLIA